MANSYTPLKQVQLVREGSIHSRPSITSTAEAMRFMRKYWQDCPGNDQERCVVVNLDTKHRPLSIVTITQGTLNASLIHPREVFKSAIIEGAASIIFSHNHPSGDPAPSHEDKQVFKTLDEAGKILGINLLDAIIYGDGEDRILSMREDDPFYR